LKMFIAFLIELLGYRPYLVDEMNLFENDFKKYDIHYRHRKYNVILTPAQNSVNNIPKI